jgi:hypothetical protein
LDICPVRRISSALSIDDRQNWTEFLPCPIKLGLVFPDLDPSTAGLSPMFNRLDPTFRPSSIRDGPEIDPLFGHFWSGRAQAPMFHGKIMEWGTRGTVFAGVQTRAGAHEVAFISRRSENHPLKSQFGDPVRAVNRSTFCIAATLECFTRSAGNVSRPDPVAGHTEQGCSQGLQCLARGEDEPRDRPHFPSI